MVTTTESMNFFDEPQIRGDHRLPMDSKPLADRVRPKRLEEMFGQEHLIGEMAAVQQFFKAKKFPSMIFWGPPGTGKTTLANLISEVMKGDFQKLSAVDSGVQEVRLAIHKAKKLIARGKRMILFIDEIHRFNKGQQDALLGAVEEGVLTLIGATTENPSFEVNKALLSRCHVFQLLPLNAAQIKAIVTRSLQEDLVLQKFPITIRDWDFLFQLSAGDARRALNMVEAAVLWLKGQGQGFEITQIEFEKVSQQKVAVNDKSGEQHYDTISAFIKSVRGSDPDASLLWLMKMLEAGEDPLYISRRLIILASEDIGNADPSALSMALAVHEACQVLGMPECRIPLAQGVTYLACSPKSNASYLAMEAAGRAMKTAVTLDVPYHLRNGVTALMKASGYGKGYQYPHDYEAHFVKEHYFPTDIEEIGYYQPSEEGYEKVIRERLRQIWRERYPKGV